MLERKRQIQALFTNGDWFQAGDIAAIIDVTRQTAHRYLRQLVEDGRLIVDGAGRATRYRLRAEGVTRRFPTAGLEEDRVLLELSGPGSILESAPVPARSTLQYVLTELVNNAIDHSEAPEVVVKLSKEGARVTIGVIDEGVGIFEHIRDRLNLDSELEALQELSKGKTTTMPSRHSGEGIFFASKAVHQFEIQSGSLRWMVDNRRGDIAVGELDPAIVGTVVRIELDTDNVKELADVFSEYTTNFTFDKTRTIIRLYAIGETFVSRSEAKRLLNGLEKFREVVLDFKGVELVGQGFADEVFRVWDRQHPDTDLVPTDMSPPIEFMVERAIRRAEEN